MSEVTCDLAPELMAVLRELGEPAPMVKECVVIELYRRGLLSSGKAAEFLGMNRVLSFWGVFCASPKISDVEA